MPAVSTPGRAALTSLTLKDFRNYPDLAIAVEAPLIVLTGRNGVGKTNLLEAISLLTPGRGFRRASFSEITRRGTEAGWAVAAVVERNGIETRIGTGLAGHGIGETAGRRVRVNGADAPVEDLLDRLRVLWLTPAMDGLFGGPPSERRRFLDRLVLTVNPDHARRSRAFDRLLTQRNRLLEDGQSAKWIEAVEAQLAEHAVAIGLARAETTTLLSARIAAGAGTSAFPAGRLKLQGDFDAAAAGRSAAEAEAAYRQDLARSRAADLAAGRTLKGPHRSDLDVTFAEKEMPAALSSTGEQKALLIGLILAHAEIVAEISGMAPVLLLDEVAAHLDPSRRAALFDRLALLGSQAFMTGTDVSLFEAVRHAGDIFAVADNRLERLTAI